jgi:hypothetical protein
VITCYRDLHAFLRKRADVIGVSRERLDEIAGLPTRYAATVLALDGAKRMSLETAFAIMGAMGLVMTLQEDAELMRKISDSVGTRVVGKVTASRRASRARRERKLLRDMSKRANFERNRKLSPEQRSSIASRAATARWSKERRERRQRKRTTKCKPNSSPITGSRPTSRVTAAMA